MKTLLLKTFEYFANKYLLQIKRVDSAGTTWLFTRAVIYNKTGKAKETGNIAVKGKIPKTFKFESMLPENLIETRITIDKQDFKLFKHNILFVANNKVFITKILKGNNPVIKTYDLKTATNNRIWVMPKQLEDIIDVDSINLCVTKGSKALLLEFNKQTEMLQVVLDYRTKPTNNEFIIDDKKYALVDWDEQTQSYKTVKETAMIKPPSLPNLKTTKNTKEEMTDPGVINILDGLEEIVASTAEELSDVMLKDADVARKEETETSVKVESEVTVAEEPKNEAPEEVKDNKKKDEDKKDVEGKRSRTPRTKKKLQDLTNTIEALRTDPPEDITVDELMEEVRQLREVIKMASSRMVNLINLATAKMRKAEEVQKKLEEITCLLSQKS